MDTITTPNRLFSARLRELREAAGLTIPELADRADITRQFLWHIECTNKAPSWETACRLADALGVDVAEFRAEKKSRKKS